MNPTFFETPAELRTWLEKNHTKATELWLGFHKKGSGKPSVTYAEALDEALCLGWIDGVRKSLGDESYTIRFTPRRRGSIWSGINIKRATELTTLGRMAPAGLRAFEARDEKKSAIYTYEKPPAELAPAEVRAFRANKKAWAFWSAQPPGYRRLALGWVTGAKKDETRARRLAQLVEDSANGRRLAQYTLQKR